MDCMMEKVYLNGRTIDGMKGIIKQELRMDGENQQMDKMGRGQGFGKMVC